MKNKSKTLGKVHNIFMKMNVFMNIFCDLTIDLETSGVTFPVCGKLGSMENV